MKQLETTLSGWLDGHNCHDMTKHPNRGETMEIDNKFSFKTATFWKEV